MLQLAEMYWEGLGTAANCTTAHEYLKTFLEERAPWRDDIEAATAMLDAGSPWAGLLRMAQVLLLFRCAEQEPALAWCGHLLPAVHQAAWAAACEMLAACLHVLCV